jgi:putative membrane protein
VSPVGFIAQGFVRGLAWGTTKARLDVAIEGVEHLPRTGPALIAARHFHHLWDGAILIGRLPRPVRLVVAADWASGRRRSVLLGACRLLDWPALLRREAAGDEAAGRLLRVATADVVHLLLRGGVVAVFPEGYPTIDPAGPTKPDRETILPFRPGVVRFAQLAERAGAGQIPIVPAGFWYAPDSRRRVVLRLGRPWSVGDGEPRALAAGLEAAVRALSAPPVSLRDTIENW